MSVSPAVRARAGISHPDLQYLVGRNKYSYDQLKAILIAMLIDVIKNTIFDLELFIDEKVPKRTGMLRESLKNALQNSVVIGYQGSLIVGSAISYASYVNDMPTGWVRHYNTPYEHSGAKAYAHGAPVILDDPNAIGHSITKLIEYAKERLLTNLDKGKYELASGSALTTRELSRVKILG